MTDDLEKIICHSNSWYKTIVKTTEWQGYDFLEKGLNDAEVRRDLRLFHQSVKPEKTRKHVLQHPSSEKTT